MSRNTYFTVDQTLARVLQDMDTEFYGDSSSQNELAEASDRSENVQIEMSDETDVELSVNNEEPPEINVAEAASLFFDGATPQEPAGAVSETDSAPTAPPCGCKEECMKRFTPAQVEDTRLNFIGMEKDKKDNILIGLIEGSRYAADTTTKGKKRQRQCFRYSYAGVEVCVSAFRYIYDVGPKQLENILKHLNVNGPVPREHGNKRRTPHNALTYPVVENVVTYLKAVANRYGIPHPAPLHGRAGTPPIYLAASNTIRSIHSQYCTSCVDSGIQAVGYDSFRSIWSVTVPHITIASPRTDVCDTCEGIRRQVTSAVTDGAKHAAGQALVAHTTEAQHERDYYAELTVKARAEIEAIDMLAPPVAAASQSLTCPHYTFDYAQNVALPQSSRQEGPLFFKVPRKVQVFGVNCEAVPRQVNYLIDEADSIGADGKNSHGPNSVVSLLHHYFATYGMGEQESHMHADNCSGQNKNKTMCAYLAWRVIVGLHNKISLHFMLTGHTRCLVDGCFGLFKQKFRRSDCYSFSQLEQVVNSSAQTNVAHVLRSSPVEWRCWDSFFVNYFKPIKGIRELHHLEFDRSKPGVVSVRKSLSDEPQDVQILATTKEALLAAGLPAILPAAGLSAARMEYLYKSIRPHVPAEFQDELCPKPPPAILPEAE